MTFLSPSIRTIFFGPVISSESENPFEIVIRPACENLIKR